ncbi:MAG: hypothetical protein LIP01_05300 [Tannerellaceae bacterium]|nr:hypothetical protein [Tannerellaceae bacterium]
MTTGTELSFKEKKRIILELNNEAYAEADLELLHKLTPRYAFMHKVEKNPVKHHKEIITELVEKTDRDTIRLNRRAYDDKKMHQQIPARILKEHHQTHPEQIHPMDLLEAMILIKHQPPATPAMKTQERLIPR